MHPKTRREDIVVRELDKETLLYVSESNEAHCLNQAAALVWRNCDGQTSKAELARILSRELGGAADIRVVDLALDELQKAKLLVAGAPRVIRGYSRRAALAKLGAGLAALPAVMSIVAPEAKAQASPTFGGSGTTIINNNSITNIAGDDVNAVNINPNLNITDPIITP